MNKLIYFNKTNCPEKFSFSGMFSCHQNGPVKGSGLWDPHVLLQWLGQATATTQQELFFWSLGWPAWNGNGLKHLKNSQFLWISAAKIANPQCANHRLCSQIFSVELAHEWFTSFNGDVQTTFQNATAAPSRSLSSAARSALLDQVRRHQNTLLNVDPFLRQKWSALVIYILYIYY